MTIFKEINKAVEKLTADRKVVQTNAEIKLINKKLKALRVVAAYIKGGTWATKKSFVERINYTLSHSRELAAKKFGVSEGSINVSISLANKMLRERLGDDIIKQIMSGNWEEAVLRVNIANGSLSLSNAIFSDVLALMPEPAANNLNIKDCITELKFLRGCSINSLKKSIAKMDSNKLAYVLDLYNKTTDSKLKVLIYNYISNESEDGYEDLVNYLNTFTSAEPIEDGSV
jgi:hypothetical protein